MTGRGPLRDKTVAAVHRAFCGASCTFSPLTADMETLVDDVIKILTGEREDCAAYASRLVRLQPGIGWQTLETAIKLMPDSERRP
jgi:hypothetical protein